MKLYAFQNKKTKKLMTGTDFTKRAKPIYSKYSSPIFLTEEEIWEIPFSLECVVNTRKLNFDKFDLVECELSISRAVDEDERQKMIDGEYGEAEQKILSPHF